MKRQNERSRSKDIRPRAQRKVSARVSKPEPNRNQVILMVGTRKGTFIYRGDSKRSRWSLDGPHRLGEIVNHVVLDPRDRTTMLMAARAGHLGPTIFRSEDFGR